jgi:DNA topoisomerase-2
MAQTFVGSNNINLLCPIGQFGSRLLGGKDAASPRYIHTHLEPVIDVLFRKEDAPILKHLEDDGDIVEPDTYLPVVPLLAINGSVGIGTGFSTNIPSYDPLDIVDLLKRMLDGEDLNEEEDDIEPWYRGFKGEIRKIGAKYYTIGVFKRLAPTKIQVTELPIGYCTFDFKGDLEAALDKIPDFKKYENESNENDVKVTLHFTNKEAVDKFMVIETNGFTKFENDFKLVNSKLLSTTNMYAFNHRGAITKYTSAFHMIRDFYGVRLDYYAKRKAFVLGQLQYDADIMANKIRFIKDVIAEKVYIHKIKKTELEEYLETNQYLLHEDSYDYIIRIPIYNLTTDKVAELEAQIKKALECIEKLRNMSTEDIWLEELEEFEKLYAKF